MTKLSLINICLLVAKREWRLVVRQSSDVLNPLLFFIVIVSLFPLAIGPRPALLQAIAPGVIWVAALLANLLGLDRLFRTDYDEGTVEHYLLSPYPTSLLLATKIVIHWLITGFPLMLLSPLLALMFHIPWVETRVLIVSLLLGTPILSFVGAILLALTVSLRSSGVLLALCLMPLMIPVLIFGAGSVMRAGMGMAVGGQLALLAAILLLSLSFVPLVVAGALRMGVE